MARLNIPSVWIEQRITIFSYFRIQLDFDQRLRKVINVVLNSGSVMAFCAKVFLHESPGKRYGQKSQKPTCDLLLLLSKPRGLPIGAFFQSRNSGESVPCRYKWSKRADSILAEYYLRIQYIRPLGPGNTPGLHLSTSVDLHFHLFPHPMYHQQSRGITGILFRMASRQTATISTSCSIWPHEILAFTTSAYSSFCSSYVLAHFQVFTVQSHATQLTSLCADAVVWITLPVNYFHFRLFLSWRRWGRVRCFV